MLYLQGTEVERFARRYKLLSPSHRLGSLGVHHHTAHIFVSMMYVSRRFLVAASRKLTLCFRRLHLLQARVMRGFRLAVFWLWMPVAHGASVMPVVPVVPIGCSGLKQADTSCSCVEVRWPSLSICSMMILVRMKGMSGATSPQS